MIISRRNYGREEAIREAKSIYIFCEGVSKEYDYFKFFRELDSRINVVVHNFSSQEDNSPLGLLKMAMACIYPDEEGVIPEYSLMENDEVWLVFDRDHDKEDSRASQINEIRETCASQVDWFAAISNPCFEVWLYYHCHTKKPVFEGIDCSAEWKTFVNDAIKGGFDSRKHPGLIEASIENAVNNYEDTDGEPDIASTEVFRLGEVIFRFVKDKLS
jgi:hypothetical protein